MCAIQVRIGRGVQEWIPERNVVVPESYPHRIGKNTPDEALASPTGMAALETYARPGRTAVVIPDATRSWQRVPLMAKAIRARLGGIPVTWVLGTGLHRASTDAEVEALLESARLPEDTVISHDCDRVIECGETTSRGTPVTLCPEVAAAETVVLVGGIVYHDLAGFSGGRKALCPGVSGRKSVQANHGLALLGDRIRPEVGSGLLDDNPAAADMDEYARICGRSRVLYVLNVAPDGRGVPYRYVAGDPERAWKEGVEAAKALQTLHVRERVDSVVVSCGGFPADLDLYQATKALPAVTGILRPQGGVILCADLEDGIGPGHFEQAMRLAVSDRNALLEELRRNFTIPSFIAFKTLRDLSGRPAALVTSRKDVPFPGEVFSSVGEAWRWMEKRMPSGTVAFVGAGNGVRVRALE